MMESLVPQSTPTSLGLSSTHAAPILSAGPSLSGPSSSPQKLNITAILKNNYASPYSFQDFLAYTQHMKCDELVEYWRAVHAYHRKLSRTKDISGGSYKNRGHGERDEENEDEDELDMGGDDILGPTNYPSISSAGSSTLVSHRPSIFKYDNLDSCTNSKELTASPIHLQSPSSTTQQHHHDRKSETPGGLLKSILNMLKMHEDAVGGHKGRPRASSDPHNALKGGQREEVPGEDIALPQVRESHPSSSLTMLADKVKNLSRVNSTQNDYALDIINLFIRQGSPKEINVPSKISKKILRDYDLGVRDLGLFQSSLDHVEFILHTSILPGFLSYASTLPGAASVTQRPKGPSPYVRKTDGLELVRKMAPK